MGKARAAAAPATRAPATTRAPAPTATARGVALERAPAGALAAGFDLGRVSMAPTPRSNLSWTTALLQPAARVGPVDDPFEREADALAAAVTADVADHAAPPSPRAPSPVAPAAPVSGPAAEAAAPASEPIEERELEEGGERLPGHVRTFFEGRLGFDFGHVRVHRGERADAYTDALDAHAFTWRNHVWLGAGQRVDRGFVMAHELVHVAQQTRPGPAAPEAVQRKAYWQGKFAGKGKPGEETHSWVLPIFGAKHNLFTEAPIPNANTKPPGGVDYGRRGAADLYSGKDLSGTDRTIGVYFQYAGTPVTLPSWRDTKFAGAKVAHKKIARPKLGSGDTVVDVHEAPVNIGLADLKPTDGSLEAKAGPKQLSDYKGGIELAADETNKLSTGSKVKPPGSTWSPKVGFLTGLAIPPEFAAPLATGQASRELYLVDGGVPHFPKDQKVMGKLYVQESSGGIYNYTWAPDSFAAPAAGVSVVQLYKGVYKDVILPATRIQTKRRARGAPAGRRLSARARAPVVQRAKKAPAQDKFVLATWQGKVRTYTDQRKGLLTKQEWKDAQYTKRAVEAQEAAKKAVPKLQGPPAAAVEDARKVSKIDFWTGASANAMGRFRAAFGGVYVKVLQFYEKARDRLHEMFGQQKATTGGKSGLIGSVIKFAFRVIKAAARLLVERTGDELMSSFERGVSDWLQKLIPDEATEELEKIKDTLDGLRKEIEAAVLGTVDDLVKKVIGPYEELIKKIEGAAALASKLASLVKWVRWGARAIACLSPPGWGCLLTLAEPVIDWAAGKVVETCWFQRKAAHLVTGIDFVKGIPKELARMLIEDVIKPLLPSSLHGLFPLPVISTAIDSDKLECEKGSDTTPLTREQERLLLMQERIGEERMKALSELVKRHKIPPDRPLTVEDIERMEQAILKGNLTVEDLKGAAARSEKLKPLATLFDEAKGRKGQPGYKSAEQRMKEEAAEAEYVTVVVGKRPGAGEADEKPAAGKQEGGGAADQKGVAGGVPVYKASELATAATTGAPSKVSATLRIVGARGTDWDPASPDREVARDGWFYVGQKATGKVIGLRLKPFDSGWYPSGTNKDTATCFLIKYILRQGVHFPPPNQNLYYKVGTEFTAYIHLAGRAGKCPW